MDKTASRLHAIARTVLDERDERYDPWLYDYWQTAATQEAAARYMRYQRDHLKLAGIDPQGLSVVDAGCGFGLTLIALGLLGAETLRGVEIHEGMVRTVHAYQDRIPVPLEVTHGSVGGMPYEDQSADLMLSYEAISHYLDVPAFLAEAARVLKPGGTLIVSDGNNGANPSVRRKTRVIWRTFELDGGEAHGHTVQTTYAEMRERIIAARDPRLPARQLALATSGMVRGEVEEAAERYLETGVMPDRRFDPDQVPVHPDGQVIERLFDPHELGREIGLHGFRTKVYGYWGGASGKRALRAANRALASISRLTIRTAPAFRLVGRRQ